MNMQAAIRAVSEHRDLTMEEMTAVMRLVMKGAATPAQVGGFLIGLRMKGETVDEITAAARVMRALVSPVVVDPTGLVDTCGTGGDATGTFNISTAAAFVVAAAGGKVAKHGNRSVSSKSGSADVLEAAGVNIELSPQQVAHCIDKVGVGFMFAPRHHGAMKHAIGPRREMGVRTIFNLLGPLTNPAGAQHQVIGVFNAQWLEPLALVLERLGSRHVLVVHAEDGLDEISIATMTHVVELRAGKISRYTVSPRDFAMEVAGIETLAVGSAVESLDIIHEIFAGCRGPAADIVALNAGAALYAADLADSMAAGVARAQQVLLSGAASDRLSALVQLTQTLGRAL